MSGGVNVAFYGEVVNPLTSIDAPDTADGILTFSGGVETLPIGTVPLGGKAAAGFSLEALAGFAISPILVTVTIQSAGLSSILDTFTWAPAVTAFAQSYHPVVGETLTVEITTDAAQVALGRIRGAVYASSI